MRMYIAAAAIAFAMVSAPSSYAMGPNENYGRVFCQYFKTKAMAAQDQNRKASLYAQYKNCRKDYG